MAPTSVVMVAATSPSVIRARPKSSTFTAGRGTPERLPVLEAVSSVTMMFSGLRSRWMTPRWWA
jgi:hypothetical protein